MDFTDVAKMMSRKSCAELEGVINEAAIYAGFERSAKVCMRHLVTGDMQKNAANIVTNYITDILGKELKPWQSAENQAKEH